MDFAVRMLNEPPDKGRWVLGVDHVGERFLTTDEGGRFAWVDASSCMLFKVATPEQPRPVIAVQPNKPIMLPANGIRGIG